MTTKIPTPLAARAQEDLVNESSEIFARRSQHGNGVLKCHMGEVLSMVGPAFPCFFGSVDIAWRWLCVFLSFDCSSAWYVMEASE